MNGFFYIDLWFGLLHVCDPITVPVLPKLYREHFISKLLRIKDIGSFPVTVCLLCRRK